MTQQPWLAAAFAVIMVATAAYCLTRLGLSVRQRRPADRPVDALHVLMGVAMAGMLVPRLRVVPAAGWEALFAAGAALFLWRLARTTHRAGHDVQHLLGCGAMVYMLAATTGSAAGPVTAGRTALGTTLGTTAASASGTAAGAMSGAAGVAGLSLVLAVALVGCVVWSADRISTMAPVAVLASSAAVLASTAEHAPGPSPARSRSRSGVPVSPRLAACCEIAMGVTMGYMLIVLR